MGKHKRQKRGQKNSSSASSKFDPRTEKLKEGRILPLLAGLKSAKPIERALSLSAASSLLDEKTTRDLLIREGLLEIILSFTLSDSSNEIVAEAFGLLRNIVLDEGRDKAIFLLNQNIAAYMSSASELIFQNEERSKVIYELSENICGLLTALIINADNIDEDQRLFKVVQVADLLIRDNYAPTRLHNVAFELLFYSTSEGWPTMHPGDMESFALTTTSRVYEAGIGYYVNEDLNAVAEKLESLVGELDLGNSKATARESKDNFDTSESQLSSKRIIYNAAQVFFEVSACVAEFLPLNILPKALEAVQIDDLVPASFSYINNQGWTLSSMGQKWSPDEADAIWRVSIPLLPIHATSALRPLVCIAQQYEKLLDDIPLATLMDKAEEYRLSENRADWMELVSALVLAVPLAPGIANRSVNILFQVFENPTEVAPLLVIDSLDALFDLFGDNDATYDKQIYQNGGYNKRLIDASRSIEKRVRSVAQSDQLGERALESLINLENFIEYKASAF